MRIGVVTFSSFLVDQRIIREVKVLLEQGHQVDVYDSAVQPKDDPNIRVIDDVVYHHLLESDHLRFFNSAGRLNIAGIIAKQNYDVIHCHDFQALWIVGLIYSKNLFAGKRPKLIYDSHEYFIGYPAYPVVNKLNLITRFRLSIIKKFLNNTERKYIQYTDEVITVGDQIANDMFTRFNLKKKVVVLRNIAEISVEDLNTQFDLRSEFNIPADHFLFIYVGSYISGWDHAQVEFYKKMNRFLNCSLVLLIRGNYSDAIARLTELYGVKDRVHIKKPVRKELVPAVIRAADASVIPVWQPKFLSYWFLCPNKLFDAFQSGKPLFTTAQPEFVHYLNTYRNGTFYNPTVENDFEKAMGELINHYDIYLRNAKESTQHFSWGDEKKKLSDLYKNL